MEQLKVINKYLKWTLQTIGMILLNGLAISLIVLNLVKNDGVVRELAEIETFPKEFIDWVVLNFAPSYFSALDWGFKIMLSIGAVITTILSMGILKFMYKEHRADKRVKMLKGEDKDAREKTRYLG